MLAIFANLVPLELGCRPFNKACYVQVKAASQSINQTCPKYVLFLTVRLRTLLTFFQLSEEDKQILAEHHKNAQNSEHPAHADHPEVWLSALFKLTG